MGGIRRYLVARINGIFLGATLGGCSIVGPRQDVPDVNQLRSSMHIVEPEKQMLVVTNVEGEQGATYVFTVCIHPDFERPVTEWAAHVLPLQLNKKPDENTIDL